jgi:riboflavin kinase/FMN adenylyltransferase/tRNA pseudouridine(55) synthase
LGDTVDGFVNLDKESGISSHQAVAALRRLLNCKAGHAGTLDPAATGVLPLCLGKATRLAEYVSGQAKLYSAVIRFGVETDSYDAEGSVLARQDASHVRQADVEALLPRFSGTIMQTPPLISALKQGGQPLYKRARRGESIELTARPVQLHSLELSGGAFGGPEPWAEVRIACGKGFYVRSLAHDLGELLGVGAHVTALRRLAVGPFKAENAYTLRQIADMLAAGESGFLLPLGYGISHVPLFCAPPQALRSLRHGNDWPLEQAQALPLCRVETAEGELLGLGQITAREPGGYLLRMHKVLAAGPAADAAPSGGPPYSVIAIGNFDGLHLGHQELLRHMARHKERLGGPSAVLTFSPHPLQLIHGKTPPLLNTAAEKRRLIVENGADALVELPFDEKLRSSGPQTFVDEVIVKQAAARQVVVGFNFRFGAQGTGDARLLQSLCAARGVGVEIVEAVGGPYGLISSSNIRQHLLEGNMTAVSAMLGYCYELSGQVVMGNQLGRKLGFPTANFPPPPDKALPPRGVYAGRVAWQGRLYKAVINLGFRPTLGGAATEPLLEAHLFEASPELYGERITVYLAHFLRGERRFANLEELKAQISADSRAAARYLEE